MANRYWVGGTASWDGTAGTKWAATDGGPGGETVPTTVDDVFFTASSGVNTITIAAGNTGAKSITCTGFTGTLTGTAAITIAGGVTLVAGMTYTYSGTVTFTGTGTLITAGKTFNTTTVNGSGITLTLGDTLNIGSNVLTITAGTFTTTNFNVTAGAISSSNSNVRAINLGSSTVTLSSTTAIDFTTSTNLTFNAGTSQINVSHFGGNISAGSQTFYNITYTNTSGTQKYLSGSATINNLTITAPASAGVQYFYFTAACTINGTFTCAGASPTRRIQIFSSAYGTARTLTVATLSATDCDFRDITIAGAAAGSSVTRAGDCGGNSGITFPAPKTVYRKGTGNWSDTQWSATNGGGVDVNSFPLAQDTAIFNSNTTTGTHTINATYSLGTLDCSGLTSSVTLSCAVTFYVFKDFTLGSNLTLSGAGLFAFAGRSVIQAINTAGRTITQDFYIMALSGTVRFDANASISRTLTLEYGTLDLNNNAVAALIFQSSYSTARTIAFGTTGQIQVTGNNGTVWNAATLTNFTLTGVSSILFTYSGATGTRTINHGTTVFSAGLQISMTVNAGSDIAAFSGYFDNLSLTGFNGTFSNLTRTVYGNFTFSSGGTITAGANATTFAGTSGTQNFYTAGRQVPFPIIINGGSTVYPTGGSFSIASTYGVTLTLGGFDITANSTVTIGTFSSSGSGNRSVIFGVSTLILTSNSTTLWNTSTATNFSYSGTFNVQSNYTGAVGTRTFNMGDLNVDVKAAVSSNGLFFGAAATDTVAVTGTIKDFDVSAFSGTLANNARTITGSLTIGAGTTLAAGGSTTTLSATTGGPLITTNGKTLDFPLTVNSVGITTTLNGDLTLGSTRIFTLTAGSLDLNGKILSTGLFHSNSTVARSILFGVGTGAQIILTGNNAVIWNTPTSTNFTYSGDFNVYSNYAGSTGTRAFQLGSTLDVDIRTAPSTEVIAIGTAGTDIVSVNGTARIVSTTNFTGTFNIGHNLTPLNISRDFVAGATTNFTSSGGLYFTGSYAPQSLTTNGKTIPGNITVNTSNGYTVTMEDSLSLTGTLSVLKGNLDANNFNVTAAAFNSDTYNTRTVTMGSGIWTLTGSGIVWNTTCTTELTFNKNTANIILSDTSTNARYFNGGGLTYNNLTIGGSTGVSALTIRGANTFNTIASTKTVAHSIIFEKSKNTTVFSWTINGTSGNIVTLDAIDWVLASAGVDTLYSAVWSGTQFVAVGGVGIIVTSPDGVTWTTRTSGTSNTLYGVTWSGTQFLAVGNTGTILTSPDGVTWTAQTSGTSNTLYGVTWSGTQFVVVGASGAIRTSSDGVTWTGITGGNTLRNVTWGNSQFVAVGDSGTIRTSPDGVTWTTRTSGTSNGLFGVTWSGTQFVVVGNTGTIRTSSDGVTWTAQTSGTSNALYGVTWSGTQFVVVGSSIVLTSPDGVTWTAQTSGTSNTLYGVTWSGTQFLAVGNSYTILLSASSTQSTLTKTGGGLVDVNYCNIKNSNASPLTTWFAYNSVNSGNNTGWSIYSGEKSVSNFLPFI